MYVPSHFAETDPAVLHAFLREHPLALLVTPDLETTHVPVLFDPAAGPHGTLRCHVARANAHSRILAAGAEVLAVFTGPEHYISPSWYPSKQEHRKVVPTWNYIAVHARGTATSFEDPPALLAHLRELVDTHEAAFEQPWSVDDAPADFVENLTRSIIGIEIRLTSLQGKWKMSQNRPLPDRTATAGGLEALENPRSSAVAREVLRTIPQCEPPKSH
jgi:transcriptional regulator